VNAIVALEPAVREAVLGVVLGVVLGAVRRVVLGADRRAVPAVDPAVDPEATPVAAPEGAIGDRVPVAVPDRGASGVTGIDVVAERPSRIVVGVDPMRPARPPGVAWPVVEPGAWNARSRRTVRSDEIGRRNERPGPDAPSRNGLIVFVTRRPRRWLVAGPGVDRSGDQGRWNVWPCPRHPGDSPTPISCFGEH